MKYVEHKPESDFFNVKYFDVFKKILIAEVEVVNPKKALEIYSKFWDQEWNDYTIKQLVDVLKNDINIGTDKNDLMKAGIDNKNYFRDIIEILGEIADSRINQELETLLANPKLAMDAKKAIEKINSKEKVTIDQK